MTNQTDETGETEEEEDEQVEPAEVDKVTEIEKFVEPPKKKRSSKVLALVPLVITVVFSALMLPRGAAPGEVPLPKPDTRALDDAERVDNELVQDTHNHPLSPTLIILGTAVRQMLSLETRATDATEVSRSRHALDLAIEDAVAKDGIEGMRRLRAVQLSLFLTAVHGFEATGETSAELLELGGNFVTRMRDVGWVDGARHVELDDHALRAAYKMMWNQIAAAERVPPLALGLDETRALYAFYLAHPISESRLSLSLAERRKTATTEEACHGINLEEAQARERWRLDKIRRIAAVDPSYPLSFALGVEHYRLGNFPASVEAFRSQLRDHPDGDFSQLARNYMRQAIHEAEVGP